MRVLYAGQISVLPKCLLCGYNGQRPAASIYSLGVDIDLKQPAVFVDGPGW